jgi:uncharacterized cupredoxin-like copper-binding protein
MIVRSWLIIGTLIVAGAWVLMVPFSPPPFQASPGSFADTFRAENLLPKVGDLKISEEIGHEVFEVPNTDAAQLAAALAMADMEMPGMVMSESNTPGMAMAESTMPGTAMGGEEHEAGEEDQYGIAVVPAAMAAMATRTVEIEMSEWGFTPARIDVAPGEVVRFVVRNKGKIPHEFMFMPAAAMQAVRYRLERADWNLTEHEAIFEQAVVLPGDSLEATIRIVDPGAWMFMCMFPYHMQFGMMGSMATEGFAMPSMGSMKM